MYLFEGQNQFWGNSHHLILLFAHVVLAFTFLTDHVFHSKKWQRMVLLKDHASVFARFSQFNTNLIYTFHCSCQCVLFYSFSVFVTFQGSLLFSPYGDNIAFQKLESCLS